MSENKIKLSIIVVYFGEFESLKKLLASINNIKSKTKLEIIIVNNKVGDSKCKLFTKKIKNIKYFDSGDDLGYGKGNNFGVKYAKGKYLLILNPDIKLKVNAIDKLVNFLDGNQDAAIVAPNLVRANGKIFENVGTRTLTPLRGIFALSFLNKLFPNNQISSNYFLRDIPKTQIREVDTIPGSAFMIRKSVFDKLNGFDENFFMYFEEIELCKRVRELVSNSGVVNTWKIYINPESKAIHDWEPAEKTPDSKFFKESRFYYFKKHYGLFAAILVEMFARMSKRGFVFFVITIVFTTMLLAI